MRRFALIVYCLLAVFSASCTPYEEIEKTESLIEQKIENFHEQMSAEKYHEIYLQADDALHRRISEGDFIKQLTEAHARTGRVSGKPIVIVDQGLKSELHNLFSNTQLVTTFQTASCDTGAAFERFQWSVEKSNAKLVDYELRQILERGKVYGIGPAQN
jgi:hypothetical protein